MLSSVTLANMSLKFDAVTNKFLLLLILRKGVHFSSILKLGARRLLGCSVPGSRRSLERFCFYMRIQAAAGWQSPEECRISGFQMSQLIQLRDRARAASCCRLGEDHCLFRHNNQIIGKPTNTHELQANPFFLQFLLQAERTHVMDQMICRACQGATVT